MRTLIIPCAGGRTIDGVPAYIKRHPDGKFLLSKCMEGLDLSRIRDILVVIPENEERQFSVTEQIRREPGLGDRVKVQVLSRATMGAAETVYMAIKATGLTGSVLIKDCNNTIHIDGMPDGNFVAGLDLAAYKRDIHNLRYMSFLILNEQKQILDIVEKQIRAECICVGLYGFKDTRDFMFAYERLSDASYGIRQLYISHVISYLIGYQGRLFHYLAVDRYEDWRDEKSWLDIQNQYGNYFLSLDSILPDVCNIDKFAGAVNQLVSNGARVYALTSRRKEEAVDPTYRLLEENGAQMIFGCTGSAKKVFLDKEQEVIDALYTI